MLTKADDYPIHQLPIPVSEVGSERNFYDRYFFNGYSPDGEIFFASAMGIYPNLNVIDASFVLIIEGIQHNFRYSRILGQERMDTSVGSIALEIIEPLKTLKLTIDDSEKGIQAELTFNGRFNPVQEPRMTIQNGPRIFMDSTRLTQHGNWSGEINFNGSSIKIDPNNFLGTRDRSWGVRPVGAPDTQALPPLQLPQFYWLWSPVNFRDSSAHLYFVDDKEGKATHSHSVLQDNLNKTEVLLNLTKVIEYVENSRRIKKAEFSSYKDDGTEVKLLVEPKYHMYMCGLGYMHPSWGHGQYQGENESMYDTYDLSVDPHDPPFLHVQAVAECTLFNGSETQKGIGVLEELLIGKHKPSGFKDLLDR